MATPSKELVEDICTRFILTAPAEEHQSFEHLMFLVEEAHWYYEDTVRDKDRHLKSYNLNSFTRMIFQQCPELRAYVGDLEDILSRFREYKKNVPSMGAIILDKDMERVLLVKGYQSASCWGFPKGKISSTDGSYAKCAIREVMEETGFDIEPYLREEDCISKEIMNKRIKLYIIPGVDHTSTEFHPKCKGEIGAYAWHLVSDLPLTYEEDKQTFVSMDGNRHKFFMVWPFVKPLREWIAKHNSRQPRTSSSATTAAATKASRKDKPRAGAVVTNNLFKQAMSAATLPTSMGRQLSDPAQHEHQDSAIIHATKSSSFQLTFSGDGKDLLALLNHSSSSSPTPSSSSGSPPHHSLMQQLADKEHHTYTQSSSKSFSRSIPVPLSLHPNRSANLSSHCGSSALESSRSGSSSSSETSPTAPTTPPPTVSVPKMHAAADLEDQAITAADQKPIGSGLLDALLNSKAGIAKSEPVTLHTSSSRATCEGKQLLALLGKSGSEADQPVTSVQWPDFKFDTAAILAALQ